MSLLKTVKPEDATGIVAEAYQPMIDRLGMVPAPFQLISASPGILAVQKSLMDYFNQHPTLSIGLMALIRLLVAEEMKYNYCISLNRDILKLIGVADDDQLAAIMADPRKAPIPEKEIAMLELVLKVFTDPEAVEAADIQHLRDLGWTDADVLDATMMGLMMMNGGQMEKAFGLPEGAAC